MLSISNRSDRLRAIQSEKADLENYIEQHGEYMTDITNKKTYMVQYLKALSQLTGKDYAMCAPVRSDGTYGAFYVKPYDTFEKLEWNQGGVTNKVNKARKSGNLYRKLGYADKI